MAQIYTKLFKGGKLSNSHRKMIDLVEGDSKVLELGASSGYITKLLTEKACVVDIVEKDPQDAKGALKFSRNGYIGSLEEEHLLKQIKDRYDVVLAADVLEHLQDPERVLTFIKTKLNKGGRVIISLPNIACWQGRRDLFFKGKFEYKESGLFDRTHLRFYTLNSFKKLLLKSAFRIKKIYYQESSYPFKFNILKLRIIGSLTDGLISKILIKFWPNLFAYHMIFEIYAKH